MPEKILRWGLLSTARINRSLIAPIQSSKRCQLAAVASRSEETARTYASQWSIPRAYSSYEALLADPEIDVIFNPLPNSMHSEWTIKAAQAGKHVLCEKPLAVSVAEVDAIIDAAQKAGVVVAEAFMYRHHPQTIKVKEMVDSGAIGKLQLIRGAFTYNLNRPNDARLIPSLGGGSIWDVGCYPINYARYLAGKEPYELFGWQVIGSTGIDMSFMGQMHFPNEVIAQFDSGFQSPFRAYIEIVGNEAALQVPVPFIPGRSEKIYLVRGEESQTIKVRGQELYSGEVEDLADAVLLGKSPRVTLADSRQNVATIAALLESAKLGKPISIS